MKRRLSRDTPLKLRFTLKVEQRALAFQDHAAVVVGNQHPDVNPCDDFYELVEGLTRSPLLCEIIEDLFSTFDVRHIRGLVDFPKPLLKGSFKKY